MTNSLQFTKTQIFCSSPGEEEGEGQATHRSLLHPLFDLNSLIFTVTFSFSIWGSHSSSALVIHIILYYTIGNIFQEFQRNPGNQFPAGVGGRLPFHAFHFEWPDIMFNRHSSGPKIGAPHEVLEGVATTTWTDKWMADTILPASLLYNRHFKQLDKLIDNQYIT